MSNPWLIHWHEELACGCGFVLSMYDLIEGDKYANNSDRVTLVRCADHGNRKIDKTFTYKDI